MSWLSNRLPSHLGLAALFVSGVACSGGGGDSAETCSDEPGTACTWAGMKGQSGLTPDGVSRTESWLGFASDLTWGPDGLAWIVDWNNHVIRRVEADDTMTTMIGTDYEGDGPPGEIDRLPEGNPQGAPALEVALNHPTDIEFKADGTLVLAAWHNNKIRLMDPKTGLVKVLAGNSYGFAGDDGPCYAALFNQPKALAIDEDGAIYTNDQRNQRIRIIDGGGEPVIRTFAGTGEIGYAGDGGPALEAEFHFDAKPTPDPSGSLALRDGVLYVADTLNNTIRTIDLATGIVTTIAGTGETGYSGDGGDALEATFNRPLDIEFGPDGQLYIADTWNNAIRALDLSSGVVSTVAGNGQACSVVTDCYEADENVDPLDLQLLQPYGIAFDPGGNLYIADTNNSRIVKVTR